MQPFWRATTLLSVRVRRWLLRIVEASTLTLAGFFVSLLAGVIWRVGCCSYAPMSFTMTAMRRPCSLRRMCCRRVVFPDPWRALAILIVALPSLTLILIYQKARKQGHRESLRSLRLLHFDLEAKRGSDCWIEASSQHERGQQVVIKRLLVVLDLDGCGKQT
jgi:hypothetical protein